MSEQNVGEDSVQQPASDSQEQANGVITIVVTADNHLGYAAFGQSPRKREERRQRLRRAFQQAADFAIGQGVDLFVQAGDLFDTTNPDEQDRSFVATRLAQLRQTGIRTFAVGGIHDTPADVHALDGEAPPAPQISYARLGALHYFALPGRATYNSSSTVDSQEARLLEPVMLDIRATRLAICGLGVQAGQEGDPLAHITVEGDIERAALTILILHAPIEGLATDSSLLNSRVQVSRASIEKQPFFRYILAGYHHAYQHVQIGQRDVIVAGATQHIDFNDPVDDPGFVFLGLAADGVRWCRHIAVDTLQLQRLVIRTDELWPSGEDAPEPVSTDTIIERLRPLCSPDTMVQLRFEGELTRRQYHQLDLNQIRRFGEEHCFALTLDDSALSFLPEQEAVSAETGERFSPREELVTLADEWIAAAPDEQERKALQVTREELLAALDDVRYPALRGGGLH